MMGNRKAGTKAPAWPAEWRTPEWEAGYLVAQREDPRLAEAMVSTGLPIDLAGQVLAGEDALEDTGPWNPEDGRVVY